MFLDLFHYPSAFIVIHKIDFREFIQKKKAFFPFHLYRLYLMSVISGSTIIFCFMHVRNIIIDKLVRYLKSILYSSHDYLERDNRIVIRLHCLNEYNDNK
jgi:hypothetical protein